MQTEKPLIFFDGVCQLCNSVVDALLRIDQEGVFQLASLQGETAKKFLTTNERESLNSVVVVIGNTKHFESEAVLVILEKLGSPYSFFAHLGRLLPAGVRNTVYRFIAKNRYSWFGRRNTCRMPTPSERERLLP